MSKVFAIYPIDKCYSTSFLNRINTFEMRNLGDEWHCYKIHFSDKDHNDCIAASKSSRFVLYMGHGGETKLCGSCGKKGEMDVDIQIRQDNPDYYIKETFIDSSNISEFKGQIFFCFSCNSNRNTAKSLGRIAIQNNVLTFVGFGDIPTDYIESIHFSKRCIAIYKGLIIKIMRFAIYLAAKENLTMDAMVNIIRILTTKEIQSLMNSTNNIRHKEDIIKQLVQFKNEIRIFGDRYATIY